MAKQEELVGPALEYKLWEDKRDLVEILRELDPENLDRYMVFKVIELLMRIEASLLILGTGP